MRVLESRAELPDGPEEFHLTQSLAVHEGRLRGSSVVWHCGIRCGEKLDSVRKERKGPWSRAGVLVPGAGHTRRRWHGTGLCAYLHVSCFFQCANWRPMNSPTNSTCKTTPRPCRERA